ncbi:MAG: hypothetical protein ACFCD0_23070 [Gemmataceae bacterium]
MSLWWGVVIVAVLAFVLFGLPPIVFAYLRAEARKARTLFFQQQSHLQELFFSAASQSGKPRGLRWKNIEWTTNVVELARDRKTQQLVAFAGITISFEAVEGSDMEGLPAVGNLRNATALFVFHRGKWITSGKAIFNLNPDEILDTYKEQYNPVTVPDSPDSSA